MLEEGAINVIVCGITVHESIKEECVNRKPPVVGGWVVLVIGPFTPVLGRVCCIRIFVEIIVEKGLVVRPA